MKTLLLLFCVIGSAYAEFGLQKLGDAPARVSTISVSDNLLYAGTSTGEVVIFDKGGNAVARIPDRGMVRKILPLSDGLFVRETDRIAVVNHSGKQLWRTADDIASCVVEKTNSQTIIFARRDEIEECDFDGNSLRKVRIQGKPSVILTGPENVFVYTENDSFKTAGSYNLPNGKTAAEFCDLKMNSVLNGVIRGNGEIVSLGTYDLVISDGVKITSEFPRVHMWSSMLKNKDDSILLVTHSGQVFELQGSRLKHRVHLNMASDTVGHPELINLGKEVLVILQVKGGVDFFSLDGIRTRIPFESVPTAFRAAESKLYVGCADGGIFRLSQQ